MYEKMYMIFLDRHLLYLPFILSRNPLEDLPGIFRNFACQDLLSILRHPYYVVFNIVYSVFRSSYWAHTPILYLFLFLPASFARIHPGSKLPGILRYTNKGVHKKNPAYKHVSLHYTFRSTGWLRETRLWRSCFSSKLIG